MPRKEKNHWVAAQRVIWKQFGEWKLGFFLFCFKEKERFGNWELTLAKVCEAERGIGKVIETRHAIEALNFESRPQPQGFRGCSIARAVPIFRVYTFDFIFETQEGTAALILVNRPQLKATFFHFSKFFWSIV